MHPHVTYAHDCMQVGCGGAYHSWTPLYPDKSTTEQVGLLINTYSLLLDPQDDSGTNRRIYLNSSVCNIACTCMHAEILIYNYLEQHVYTRAILNLALKLIH